MAVDTSAMRSRRALASRSALWRDLDLDLSH
jgi:hypothetical protein